MKNLLLTSTIAAAGIVFFGQVHGQALNDPAIHGMQTLPRAEGCNVPGGLRPITSSDGPNDAMFWCGAPPYCLTMAPGSPERCHIIPGVRQGGLRGVRNPTDLLCDVTNVNPTGPAHAQPGRCPVPPTAGATVNNAQVATVSQGASVTLRVNTANATPLSAPTALTMACSGANAVISPFNQTNLIAYAGRDYSFPAVAAGNAGNTACTITATNTAGSATYNVSFNATPTVSTPAPTVQAEFTNSPVVVGGTRVSLRTRTTNATGNITWRCTGIWNFTDTRPSSAGWTTTTHNQGSGSAAGRSSTCTFTATGPGGSGATTATWRAVAASGGGSGSGGGSSSDTPATPTTTWLFRGCEKDSAGGGGGGGCTQRYFLGVGVGSTVRAAGSVTCRGTLRTSSMSAVPSPLRSAAYGWARSSPHLNGSIVQVWSCTG